MISYKQGNDVDCAAVLALLHPQSVGTEGFAANLPKMTALLRNSNVVVTAWDDDKMVGVARGLSDFGYLTFLVDLAVAPSQRRQGVGRELIKRCKFYSGNQTMLVLHAAETAADFYHRLGFKQQNNAMVHAFDVRFDE